MKAIIHFKDSAKVPSVTIENLRAIKAVVVYDNGRLRDKNYREDNFHAFTPFENESYAFEGSTAIISVNGAEILYVEFVND